MTFSRKKLRGFDRKLKQLDKWKKSIIHCLPELCTKPGGQIFRINLDPFTWHGDKNPHRKFHEHLYKAFSEILIELNKKEFIKSNNLTVQLWLFYPRTVKSLVIVANQNDYLKRNEQIDVVETQKIPPKIFNNYFSSFRLKLGNDNVFKEIKMCNKHFDWQKDRLGDIWTIEKSTDANTRL